MRKSNELQIGKAGEYIVCADLIMKGLIAFPSEQGLPYDIIIDTGFKMLRCQVKTTEKPRVIQQRKKETKAYIFNIKRHGVGGLKRYESNEVDLFALVELETRTVVYLKPKDMPDTLNIRVDYLKGTYYDEKGLKDFLEVNSDKYKNMGDKELSKIFGLHISAINRMRKDGYKPYMTNARYWSDMKKDAEWFYEL